MPDLINNHSILLRDVLKLHLSEANEVWFALAFVRQSGVNMIINALETLIHRGGKVYVLFANDFGATEAEAIISLQEIGVQLRYYSKPNSSFHVKAYLFKKPNSGVAIVGSSNLSSSGLTTGIEWSMSANSTEINFSIILSEYQSLWGSEYSKPITDQLIQSFEIRSHSEDLRTTIQEEDRYPIPEPVMDRQAIINDTRNYRVTRKPDERTNWEFQIYQGQLTKFSLKGDFNVVVVCDYLSPSQIVFSIPYSYLKDNVLAFAHLEPDRSYMFGINKQSYKFNWHHSIKMDGRKFLVK